MWKFGGTSVGDAGRLRAVAERLVAARRQGTQVVAVLSAMGGTTDELARQAYGLSTEPQPRELDALLSAGEMMSCALAAIAVHDLGERAVSLTGAQAGIFTDDAHGNARLQQIPPQRIIRALDEGAIVLVAGFQGVSGHGDVTTLGRGGSDATAIALASALGARECDIFTDVPGVFTADPRVVPDARKLTAISHEEMLQLADGGARVLQARAVELAAAHDIDIHVRSSFTSEPGTWIRRQISALEDERIAGIAHTGHDPVYTVSCPSPAMVTAAMAQRGLAIGLILHDERSVRFTAPGVGCAQVTAAMAAMDLDVSVRDDLGSVSVGQLHGGQPVRHHRDHPVRPGKQRHPRAADHLHAQPGLLPRPGCRCRPGRTSPARRLPAACRRGKHFGQFGDGNVATRASSSSLEVAWRPRLAMRAGLLAARPRHAPSRIKPHATT